LWGFVYGNAEPRKENLFVLTKDSAVKGYLPMTETMFYILLSLSEPRHGYGVFLHVLSLTDGRIRLGAGTIYNSLSRLERDGLIQLHSETERRKIYRIMETGKDVLQAELRRLDELLKNGKKYL
jgi:DNA-binding PadR family transcriptional regulator